MAALNGDPKQGWESIYDIQASFDGHHKWPTTMKMQQADGTLAETDEQNAEVLQPHFDKLFNPPPKAPDFSVLDDIEQRKPRIDLDSPPTMEEMEHHIKLAKNHKASGESGVPSEAIKALEGFAKEHLLQAFIEFFENDLDPTEWHHVILKCLYKNKGDPANPNNWWGICLTDGCRKIFNSMMAERLTKVLEDYCNEAQSGGQPKQGTLDGFFVLRAALQTW